jgi:FixJ family two-component response regulator
MNAGSHLVLVVDDDLAVRESLKFALELEGLEVLVCGGGAELVGHPHLMRAGCVVLDCQMPGMNGFEVVNALKTRDCRVPVVFITSNATPSLRQRAATAGVRHVVEKPLLDSALIESIVDILN